MRDSCYVILFIRVTWGGVLAWRDRIRSGLITIMRIPILSFSYAHYIYILPIPILELFIFQYEFIIISLFSNTVKPTYNKPFIRRKSPYNGQQ